MLDGAVHNEYRQFVRVVIERLMVAGRFQGFGLVSVASLIHLLVTSLCLDGNPTSIEGSIAC
jgi:hypothetical protein